MAKAPNSELALTRGQEINRSAENWEREMERPPRTLPDLPWLREVCCGLRYTAAPLPASEFELTHLLQKLPPVIISLRGEFESRLRHHSSIFEKVFDLAPGRPATCTRLSDSTACAPRMKPSPRMLRSIRRIAGETLQEFNNKIPKWAAGQRPGQFVKFAWSEVFSEMRDCLIPGYRDAEARKIECWKRVVETNPAAAGLSLCRVRDLFVEVRRGKSSGISESAHSCFMELCDVALSMFNLESFSILQLLNLTARLEQRILDRLAELASSRRELSRPLSPDELAAVFRHNWKTVKTWLSSNGGPIYSVRLSDKAYLIDLAMLPEGWKNRLSLDRGRT